MFHSAALKLTLWYLAIIMLISVLFSFSLYHVSSGEIGRNVNRQISYFNNLLGPVESQSYGRLRQRQLSEDLTKIKAKLVLFNFIVLLGGASASYWLARRTLDPIEQALEAQSRFASDASHELRTPLAAIQAENEVALRDKSLTKAEAIVVIKSNLEEVGKLKTLSEGLLRLAAGNGKIENLQSIKLKPLLETAVERYRKAASAKNIRIIITAGDQTIIGDQDSLIELFSVFIDNAIKYSPAGKDVRVSAKRQGNKVAVKIADNGIGIKQSELPHIFERFYQTEASRHKDQPGGYGLGLAIAKNIVEAHQGHIQVTSVQGKKTAFTVFLPAA